MNEATGIATPKKRVTKPGRVRVMVSITEENASILRQMAIDESPVFPRELNEFLSILIDRKFGELTAPAEA